LDTLKLSAAQDSACDITFNDMMTELDYAGYDGYIPWEPEEEIKPLKIPGRHRSGRVKWFPNFRYGPGAHRKARRDT
jgi:hypothetical protein